MCSNSSQMSLAGYSVNCEDVATTIVSKNLSIAGLVAKGLDLSKMHEVPKVKLLTSNPVFAKQIIEVANSSYSHLIFTGGFKSLIDECTVTCSKTPEKNTISEVEKVLATV
jgi:hypothetical protein